MGAAVGGAFDADSDQGIDFVSLTSIDMIIGTGDEELNPAIMEARRELYK